MPILEIKINGTTVCQVGGSLFSQIGAYIGYSSKSPEATLMMDGYRETGQFTTEHSEWPGHTLSEGDEVTIAIHSTGEITPPVRSSVIDTGPHHEDLDKLIADMVAEKRLKSDGPGPVLTEEALSKSRLFCSFCAKHSSEVKTLIAGPSVYICSDCIHICNELIANDNGKG